MLLILLLLLLIFTAMKLVCGWYAVTTSNLRYPTYFSAFFHFLIKQRTVHFLPSSVSSIPIYLFRLATAPSAPTTISITFADVFHNHGIFLTRFWYFSTVSRSFSSVSLSPGTAILIIQLWSIYLLFTIMSGLLAWMTWILLHTSLCVTKRDKEENHILKQGIATVVANVLRLESQSGRFARPLCSRPHWLWTPWEPVHSKIWQNKCICFLFLRQSILLQDTLSQRFQCLWSTGYFWLWKL